MKLQPLSLIFLAVSVLAAIRQSSPEVLPSTVAFVAESSAGYSMAVATAPSSGSTNSSPTLATATVPSNVGSSSIPLVVSQTTTWVSVPPTVYLSAPPHPHPTTAAADSDTTTVIVNQCMITGRKGSIICSSLPVVYVSSTAVTTLSDRPTISVTPSASVSSVVVPNLSSDSASGSVETVLFTVT